MTKSGSGVPNAAPQEPEAPDYVLRFFITGQTPRSTTAIANIRKICDEHLEGRYSLDVVDIYQHPEMAVSAQIIAAPTVVKMLPEPLRRIIGDLSDVDKVLVGLDLRKKKQTPP